MAHNKDVKKRSMGGGPDESRQKSRNSRLRRDSPIVEKNKEGNVRVSSEPKEKGSRAASAKNS